MVGIGIKGPIWGRGILHHSKRDEYSLTIEKRRAPLIAGFKFQDAGLDPAPESDWRDPRQRAHLCRGEPPKYWAKEAKEAFAQLPPELQAVVLAQEGPREEAASKAKEAAAQETARARGELAKVQTIVEGLSVLVPKAIQTFKDRWEGVDWAETIRQHGSEQAMIWKAEADEQATQIQQLQQAQAEAEQTARVAFVQAEAEKLRGTPLETVEARQEVAKYLLGVSAEYQQRIHDADALDYQIAHKAMLWDRAQAQLKAKPPTKTAAPVKQAVRPAAGKASPTSSNSQAANRFAQTRSIDDAVALLLQPRGA